MVYILAFDSSTTLCSAALFEDGRLLAKVEAEGANAHAASLAVLCQQLLLDNKISFKQLGAIVLGSGPGSYTGLRIGASFAKGLCAALQIPLLSISSLQVLASAFQNRFPNNGHAIIAMIDARRDEVYSAIFDSKLKPLRETKAEILSPGMYDYLTDNGLIAIGDGAAKAERILQNGRILYPNEFQHPKAEYMGSIAHEKLTNGEIENLASFTPYYLKDFIAGRSKFSL